MTSSVFVLFVRHPLAVLLPYPRPSGEKFFGILSSQPDVVIRLRDAPATNLVCCAAATGTYKIDIIKSEKLTPIVCISEFSAELY